jgi:predicted membrane-bound spermidine synthase
MKLTALKYPLFTLLFFISGMTGLVYESVWSQYMKILAGHAAFAQSFILVIFLTGLAIGAWFAVRLQVKVRNLFILYAILEFAIGFLALIFHPLFYHVSQWLSDYLYPNVDQKMAEVVKWSFATVATLPQTILLGATFPVLTNALSRSRTTKQERIVPQLYFINSLGASIGVLISGFLLIGKFGLQGSMIISGTVNILIAIAAILGARIPGNDSSPVAPETRKREKSKNVEWTPRSKVGIPAFTRLILIASFLTGTTSFMYEIAWLRMLSMTLGSSVHAFELMLSAFILGLAIGSWWIKYRIGVKRDLLFIFAVIQSLMGAFAVLSIVGYNYTFDLMSWLMTHLHHNERGYLLFTAGSHLMAMVVMLPATICAGMSLPLLTALLQKVSHAEQAVGKVYSLDTAGGILGVLVAIHFFMPVFGLKYLLIVAGAVDIFTGLLFLWLRSDISNRKATFLFIAGSAAFLLIAIVFIHPNRTKMASGVYRFGIIDAANKLFFHKDGKTATIAVHQSAYGSLTLTTNGKPDASVNVLDRPSADESTQVLLGAIHMLYNYKASDIAIIGLGCGKTAHVALTNPFIRQLDVIEIEPAVYEAAAYFREYVGNIYTDKRFRIHFDDAKSYFTRSGQKYDVIISEPSNPWVSGIGSLFSSEFYETVQKKLNNEGLFVQWIQTYEISIPLVASIMKSFSPCFDDYKVCLMNDGDIAVIGKKHGKLEENYTELFRNTILAAELDHVRIASENDLASRITGNKEMLEPFFAPIKVKPNSDYHPILEYEAGKALFLKSSAASLTDILRYEK